MANNFKPIVFHFHATCEPVTTVEDGNVKISFDNVTVTPCDCKVLNSGPVYRDEPRTRGRMTDAPE